MACKRQRHEDLEGIRFLDEAPETPEVSNPKPNAPKAKRRERPVTLLVFLAVVGGGLALRTAGLWSGDVRVQDRIEKRFEVGPSPKIEVEAFEGAVRVDRGRSDEVSCRIELEAQGPTEAEARRNLEHVRAIVSGDSETVRVLVSRLRGHGRASIRLEVPDDARLRIATRNGRVRVEEVEGSIAVRTTNGPIDVKEAGGLLLLETTNGPIDCEGRDAVVIARTSNGRLRFRGSLAPGTSRLTTSNGPVDVRLDASQRLRLDAETTNGRVESDFPIRSDAGDGRATLVGDVGGDSPEAELILRTTNGKIEVERDDD